MELRFVIRKVRDEHMGDNIYKQKEVKILQYRNVYRDATTGKTGIATDWQDVPLGEEEL